jgi:hypothetical protein
MRKVNYINIFEQALIVQLFRTGQGQVYILWLVPHLNSLCPVLSIFVRSETCDLHRKSSNVNSLNIETSDYQQNLILHIIHIYRTFHMCITFSVKMHRIWKVPYRNIQGQVHKLWLVPHLNSLCPVLSIFVRSETCDFHRKSSNINSLNIETSDSQQNLILNIIHI